ncbi:MAG: integral rane sensor signal transduction histidine kinase [Myxococcales bacterium]|nr:integral rane sensor signal transduction histidine kinase [Myxococcales bacterium]
MSERTSPPATSPPRSASLRWRVLLVLALAAIVPTIIVGVLAIVRARDDVQREVIRGALAHIRALGSALDGTLQDSRRTVELAAATWADAPDDAQRTQLLLKRLRRDVPIVHALSILDADGKLRYGDPVPAGAAVGSHSFGGYVGDAVHAEGRPVVHLVVQARGRTGELIGVFVASLDLGFVRDLLAAARLGPGARVVVVDGAGVPVASSDGGPLGTSSLAGKDPAVDRALASSVEGTLSTAGWISAYRNLSSYQSLRGVRWAILHQQPEDQAYALARRTTRDTLIIGGVALALALALGGFFATRLTRPLAALAKRADAIAAGNADRAPPIAGPGEIGVLGQRIDEMARRIAERSELQSALARGDRLASVGVMSAQVAHEINNPLTTVLGYAKLLAEDKPDGHPDRAGLDLIASEAERMKGIIGGLLEYARTPRQSEREIGAGTDLGPRAKPDAPPSTEPATVMRHVGALLDPQLKKARAKLVTRVESTTPVAIDAHALQQVLVNLVQNAAQAMTATPDGESSGRTITITAKPAPGGIATLITVADEGPGVPAADRGRVFDPFFTTKAAGVGTGLGLAVCKHLIATAGGSIELGDGPNGRGAEFRLVIPNAR